MASLDTPKKTDGNFQVSTPRNNETQILKSGASLGLAPIQPACDECCHIGYIQTASIAYGDLDLSARNEIKVGQHWLVP